MQSKRQDGGTTNEKFLASKHVRQRTLDGIFMTVIVIFLTYDFAYIVFQERTWLSIFWVDLFCLQSARMKFALYSHTHAIYRI